MSINELRGSEEFLGSLSRTVLPVTLVDVLIGHCSAPVELGIAHSSETGGAAWARAAGFVCIIGIPRMWGAGTRFVTLGVSVRKESVRTKG